MDKVNMLNTLKQLQVELTQRLADEVGGDNNEDKIAAYKQQLLQIQSEIERVNTGNVNAQY